MGQTMQLNQFSQAPILGDTATKVNLNTLSVQVDPNSANTILPGDAVHMTSTDGNTILVDKCSATVAPFGFALYSLKLDEFTAGDAMEIGLFGQIIYAQADGVIARGNNLEYEPSAVLATGPRMKVNAGVNPISALALDNAADADIFRMMIIGQTAPVTAVISGGSINNTPIGGSTPAAGTFTIANSVVFSDTVSALTPGLAVTLDPTLGGLFTLVPAQTCTINAASVPVGHRRIVVELVTSGSSSFTVTFGTHFKSTGTLATGTVSGVTYHVVFDSNGTNFIESSRTVAQS